MLIGQNIRISRIIRNTWRIDLIMIISCTAAYLLHDNLIKFHVEIPTILPTVLGTAIAFFVGFNNNQAYDRWWEARKIWGGLVNDSRSWARSVIHYLPANENDPNGNTAKRMIYRHIAFLYALKGKLRDADDNVYKKYLLPEELAAVIPHSNVQNAILALQSKELQQLSASGRIDGFRFLQLDALLVKFCDEMGMSERIRNTVFPTTYSYLTKVFIWLFVISIAFVTSQTMGVWAIFISWLVGFVFVSTQINGMSLVNPFDNNSASVPLNQITRTIEINLLQMLEEKDIPKPITPVNNEYVL